MPHNNCNKCLTVLGYNSIYDSKFCPVCNAWAEGSCADLECSFCPERPESPNEEIDFENTSPLDIDFRLPYPSCALSNLAHSPFVFRGFQLQGMEGLLMAAKYPLAVDQIPIFSMHGFAVKKLCKNEPWWERGAMFFQGIRMDRFGVEYQEFLTEAYENLFDQNEDARAALLSTNHRTLTHSIGKRNPKDTILTVTEFISRLHNNRTRHYIDQYVKF